MCVKIHYPKCKNNERGSGGDGIAVCAGIREAKQVVRGQEVVGSVRNGRGRGGEGMVEREVGRREREAGRKGRRGRGE